MMIPLLLLARFLTLVGLAFTLQACCGSVHEISETAGAIEGRIFVVGNDPFTRVALQSDDGIMHLLRCTPETERMLRNNQGKIAKVRYRGTEQAEEGAILRVDAVELQVQ